MADGNVRSYRGDYDRQTGETPGVRRMGENRLTMGASEAVVRHGYRWDVER
jgi:hypothetical protein